MTEIDLDLLAALKRAKLKPMYFALVEKRAGEGTLIVHKMPIKLARIAEARKELGGGRIYKGRCSSNSIGGLVFETAKKPPPTLVKTLKLIIRQEAGLTLRVAAQQAVDLSDDDDEEGGPKANAVATAPPKDQAADAAAKAEIHKRLTALAGTYAKLLKESGTNGPQATKLRSQFKATKDLVAKQAWPAAKKSLDEMEKLIAEWRKAQKQAPASPGAAAGDGQAGADTSPATKPAQPAGPAKPREALIQKAPAIWHGTRAILDARVKKLKKAVRDEFAGESPELITGIEKTVSKLDVILDKLDGRLADSLAKAHAAKDAAARQVELKNSKAILADYMKYVKNEPLIAHIDANPWVPTNFQRVLTDALRQMVLAIGRGGATG
jgi:hypothetical protein